MRLLALLVLLFGSSASNQGKVLATLPSVVEKLWPGAALERSPVTLSPEQIEAASDRCGSQVRGMLFRYLVRGRDGALLATIYLDRHKVRSLSESLMVAVTPEDEIAAVQVLAFAEPLQYLPRAPWFGQFVGRRFDQELRLNRGIDGITGATLTCRAATKSVRRMFAAHLVLSAP